MRSARADPEEGAQIWRRREQNREVASARRRATDGEARPRGGTRTDDAHRRSCWLFGAGSSAGGMTGRLADRRRPRDATRCDDERDPRAGAREFESSRGRLF
eukprot:31278-Pelagococcus_subviridis.AAC.7